MGAVSPAPEPGAPLQRVREREQRQNYLRDVLECGHVVCDYDNRPVKRRRCQQCQTEPSTMD
jgi:hypothetical protein